MSKLVPKADRLKSISEYYFSKKLEEVRQLNLKGLDIINLGIGSPDLAPSSAAIEATSAALKNPKNHGYASYRSLLEFRKALADWYLKTYEVTLDPVNEVLPLLGSKEGIHYVTMAFVNPGDTVLVPNPGYPTYASTASLAGANVQYYDLTDENNWMPDFKKIETYDLSRCKLMWVNYPHMPTGQNADRTFFQELITFAKKHQILIAQDNPYSLVLNDHEPLSFLSEDTGKEVSLELNSFSKAFNMAGWRVGMVAGSREVIDCIAQVKSNVDTGMFLPIQLGAIAALKNPDRWHEERNAVYEKRRKIIWEIFDVLKFTYSKEASGLFVWGRVPRSIPDVEAYLDRILHEAHVFFVPGQVFGSNGSRFARSSLCAPEDVLQKARDRIITWVKSTS